MSIGWLLIAAAGLVVASACAAFIAMLIMGWLNKLAEEWNTEE